MQRVIERAQIGIHLLRHIAGQKAKLFAGLHRRARQHNALYLLGLEGNHRHGHGQVGFARARRAHGQRQLMLAHSLHIGALPQRFAADGAAAVGNGDDIAAAELIQQVAFALAYQRHHIADAHGIYRFTALHQRNQLRDGGFGCRDIFSVAAKLQLLPAQGTDDGQFLLQHGHVAVVHAKELLISVNIFQRKQQ